MYTTKWAIGIGLCFIGAVSMSFGDNVGDGVIRPSDEPNEVQRLMIERQYGMFIHFGINTFHDREWTDGTEPASSYAPTAIDTDDWARAAKEAGMKYVIFTAKHHEGFCLWPSEHTDYSVASSPMTTDVVAALAESCRNYGIQLGLYYSLWDRHFGEGVMRDLRPEPMDEETARDYVDYMKKQLTELLTQYGDICEIWLDGGWTQPRDIWAIDEIYALVKALQPACAVGVNWSIGRPGEPDYHAVQPHEQQEGYPIRYFPSDFRLGDPYLPGDPDPKRFYHEGELYYLPFQSTITLNRYWFFNTNDDVVKPVDELVELYERATANDNILILNSPPNRDGAMPPENVIRLRELGERLGLVEPRTP